MKQVSSSWDIASVYTPIDLTSKFAILYLFVSMIALVTLTIDFAPTLATLRRTVAAVRSKAMSRAGPSTVGSETNEESAAIEED